MKNLVLVLGAMPSEILFLRKNTRNLKENIYHDYPYFTGILDNRKIIIGITGVGITNAAVATTLFVKLFKPKIVFFTGTGARLNPSLKLGDVIIVRKAYHHNAGSLTADGMIYRKVRAPLKGKMTSYVFNLNSKLLKTANSAIKTFLQGEVTNEKNCLPLIKVGTVCSSDLFGVNQEKINDLRKKLNCDLMDMESAAIAQTCSQLEAPCCIIRAASNLVQSNPGEDYKKLGKIAAHQSARFTRHLLNEIDLDDFV